ncbi:ATP phosphoribosyltransferase (ATP-PRTase) (ATP-PRT) [Dimargaris verticillata]|uniref:ATP phosphoribosyltransferase n=1 Tax=Dimargaris verticillata TaxID=2761393 RepID=A0A9W8E9S7_9FUNG|nr:ATP phosphoribosyltransferase (ATP-PRTase) (ATP-PRT) [Dimargaris verticillata]
MELFSDLNDRLLFAVPKKGRLHEKCLEFLAGADIQFHRKPRHDIALVKNHPMALVFLPAADIAKFVGLGKVDLGITGEDIIAETFLDQAERQSRIRQVMPLNFGRCRLAVQTPVKTGPTNVADLVGKRIVTSFEGLTKQYFKALEANQSNQPAAEITDAAMQTSVEFVGGSVEAACALGLADAIVDLVESGDTMRAAGLQAIGTVLESQAVLIANSRTKFSDLVAMIQARIEGVIASRKYVYVNYNIRRADLEQARDVTPGHRAPTITALLDPDWVAVSAMVLSAEVANVMDRLKTLGATDILVFTISNCRV